MIRNFALRFQQLSLSNKPVFGVFGTLQHVQQKQRIQQNNIHTSAISAGSGRDPKAFLRHNDKFFPIQDPNEERRPAVSYSCI